MGKLKFSCTLGALIRKDFRRELERVCFVNNFKLTIKEHKGFLDSEYFIEIHGENHKLIALESNIRKSLERLDD